MIDFHSHVLPGMDDGSDSLDTSLDMLRESFYQGVNVICATSHFYADEEDPRSFLERRDRAFSRLLGAIDGDDCPRILPGAEVLYFPGISVAREIRALCLRGTPFLLIEPPMMPWSDSMLDEIAQCRETLGCVPVVAHVDRYMRMLNDFSLIDRVNERKLLAQVNASFFLYRRTQDFAVNCLRQGKFQFLGSDCHDLRSRGPNMGDAEAVIREAGAAGYFANLNEKLYCALSKSTAT